MPSNRSGLPSRRSRAYRKLGWLARAACIAALIVATACGESNTRSVGSCDDSLRRADVAITFARSANPDEQTDVLIEYQLGYQLPGGHAVDFLSTDQVRTAFVYLISPLSTAEEKRLHRKLLSLPHVASVAFNVIQREGITESNGCGGA